MSPKQKPEVTLSPLSSEIASYIAQRHQLKRDEAEKTYQRSIKDIKDPVEREALNADFASNLAELAEKHVPEVWLDNAANLAKQISIVTHAVKYTNGDAKGSSMLSLEQDDAAGYLVTASLSDLDLDVVGNAGVAPIAKLVQLQVPGASLMEALINGDETPLAPFSQSPEQLSSWVKGLRLALEDNSVATHTLAKQVYFPIKEDQYHLLTPLFASSLAQQFNDKINDAKFGERSKAIREAKKAGLYHPERHVSFPGTAIQNFGGTKPQNISLLNTKRQGKTALLRSEPPSWVSSIRPPTTLSSLFMSRDLSRQTRQGIQAFRRYLISQKGKPSTLAVRQRIAQYVNTLIDSVLDYASQVQALNGGWSDQAEKLCSDQKLWLDSAHPDLEVQARRARGDWQAGVCKAFADWLNHQLNRNSKEDGIVMGALQHQYWIKLMAPRLWGYENVMDIKMSPLLKKGETS